MHKGWRTAYPVYPALGYYSDESVKSLGPTLRRPCKSCSGPILVVFALVRRHQYGSAFVLNQEHYEFRWFGLAGVSPDDVNIRGTFVEGLTRCQRHFFSAPHLHTIEPSRT